MAIEVPGVVALSGLKEPVRLKATRVSATSSRFSISSHRWAHFHPRRISRRRSAIGGGEHSFWETQMGRDPAQSARLFV